MKIGIVVTSFSWPDAPTSIPHRLMAIATGAERAGVDSFWVMDHFFQIGFFASGEDYEREPMLEAMATLGWVAARTSRIELGAQVTGVTYRHPGVLIKALTTLDVLSEGRAWLGIGAAWNESEHRGLGVPFPPLTERFERLEETLQVAHRMWSGDERAFQGVHYRLERPINQPSAVRRPHPPIMIGGSGEKKTLRFVAKYADATNLRNMEGVEALGRKLDILRRHCDDLGRPYDEIEKTVTTTVDIDDPARATAHFSELASLGFDHVMFDIPVSADASWFRRLQDDIVPAVHALVPSGREISATGES